MDSEAINPAKGPEVQISKTRASAGETAPAKPPAKTQVAEQDTVSLSDAGKIALKTGSTDDPAPSGPPQETSAPASGSKRETPSAPEGAVTGADKNREFSLTETNEVVMKIVDNRTKEVVKQIPSEEELQLKNAIRNMVEGSTEDPAEF